MKINKNKNPIIESIGSMETATPGEKPLQTTNKKLSKM